MEVDCMQEELKEHLITVLEGIEESFQDEEGQKWYEYFCKALEELKKTN